VISSTKARNSGGGSNSWAAIRSGRVCVSTPRLRHHVDGRRGWWRQRPPARSSRMHVAMASVGANTVVTPCSSPQAWRRPSAASSVPTAESTCFAECAGDASTASSRARFPDALASCPPAPAAATEVLAEVACSSRSHAAWAVQTIHTTSMNTEETRRCRRFGFTGASRFSSWLQVDRARLSRCRGPT